MCGQALTLLNIANMARASSGVINPLFACEIIDLTDESDTTMVAGAIAEQPTHTKTLGVTGKHGEGTMVDKFTLFPKMPIELRLKIWRLSLPVSPNSTPQFL